MWLQKAICETEVQVFRQPTFDRNTAGKEAEKCAVEFNRNKTSFDGGRKGFDGDMDLTLSACDAYGESNAFSARPPNLVE